MKATRYNAAFKKEAIAMVNELGLSVTEVSEKLGVHIKTLYRWLDEFRQDGNNAFPGKGKLKPDDEEIRRLKRENLDLREENDILKKATAIVCHDRMR
ncbi:MAG: transposase [Carboxydocellales bacterium]